MIAIQEVYMRSFFLATPASDRADPTPEAHSTGVVGTFSYRRSGTNRWRRMRLDPMEFIRRFLQHVLPRGLQKVRHYKNRCRELGIDVDQTLIDDILDPNIDFVIGVEAG